MLILNVSIKSYTYYNSYINPKTEQFTISPAKTSISSKQQDVKVLLLSITAFYVLILSNASIILSFVLSQRIT